MSALSTNNFSPVIRSTHEEFIARRAEGLQKISYRRPVREHTIVAALVPARPYAAA